MRRIVALLGVLGMPTPALAHFQMLYTPEIALNTGQATHMVMVFTHPANAGPNMDMSTPESFYVVSQRGDAAAPQITDLMEYVSPVSWSGGENPSRGFEARMPRLVTRSLGDYVFVLRPAPYYESGEDKYIQQITKTIVNIGGLPGNWAEPVGLPTEILPLDKPYANWTGGVFRGVVLSEGDPVPNAELEIEYVNYPPDMDAHRFAAEPEVEIPHDAFGTMGIRANDRGEFTIGLPRAGWWGICALAVGPETEHDGKELSQDAVLWIQVRDMR